MRRWCSFTSSPTKLIVAVRKFSGINKLLTYYRQTSLSSSTVSMTSIASHQRTALMREKDRQQIDSSRKMFAAHHIIQHNRLVRLVMIVIIVGLTIFLYTSYYANQTIQQLPSSQRLHMPSLISVSSVLDNGDAAAMAVDTFVQENAIGNGGNENLLVTNDGGDSSSISITGQGGGIGLSNDQDVKQQHHQQIIGNNLNNNALSNSLANNDLNNNNVVQQNLAVDDVNASYAQQQQFSDLPSSSSLALSASVAAAAAAAAILQQKTPLNTSISNASTSNVMPVGKVAMNLEEKQLQQQQSKQSPSSGAGSTSSAAVASNATTTAHHLDTTKGIRTSELYESGHSEANSDLCGTDAGEHIRLLILITSAPTHREARLAIRQTWGHYATRRDIAIGFILGATNVQSVEDALDAESYMYSDIIRGRFIDSYNNLTLKTISSLEWVDTYCPRVSFVLKTDDDMFINVPRLMSFIDKHRTDKRVIYGRLAKKWKPIRNKRSKYYVSPQQYFPSVFPQFTTGPAYLMSSDAVHDLYTKALAQTYLKLEDVFTTGIVAQLVNVKRIHVNEFLNRRIAFNPCNLRKAISIHMVKSNEQFDLWKKLLDTNTKCK